MWKVTTLDLRGLNLANEEKTPPSANIPVSRNPPCSAYELKARLRKGLALIKLFQTVLNEEFSSFSDKISLRIGES